MTLKRLVVGALALVIIAAIVVAACARNLEAPDVLRGGVLVTFDVLGEPLVAWITSEQTIGDVYAVQRGDSRATIPIGTLVRGRAYGNPWSWYLDPDSIRMVEATIEIYDARPSEVEANLDYWVGTVTRYAPWSAVIVKIEDRR